MYPFHDLEVKATSETEHHGLVGGARSNCVRDGQTKNCVTVFSYFPHPNKKLYRLTVTEKLAKLVFLKII